MATQMIPECTFAKLGTLSTTYDGIFSPEAGKAVLILNASGDEVSLTHNSGDPASNGFHANGAATFALADGLFHIAVYDATIGRWRTDYRHG